MTQLRAIEIEGCGPSDPCAPRGPVIGRYKDGPIWDTITESGRTLDYDRIAQESPPGSGCIDVDQLEDGEVLLAPGLIYRPRG